MLGDRHSPQKIFRILKNRANSKKALRGKSADKKRDAYICAPKKIIPQSFRYTFAAEGRNSGR